MENKRFFKKKRFIIPLILVIIYSGIVIFNRMYDFKAGFDMDDTLLFSSPAFVKADKIASSEGIKRFSEKYWQIVNNNIELGTLKKVPVTVALLSKLLGIDVVIITARPEISADKIKKYWHWLTDDVYFTEDKASVLNKYRFLCFIGDSDSDITAAFEAGIFPIRVIRSPKSSYKDKNHPGKYDEFILPLSVY